MSAPHSAEQAALIIDEMVRWGVTDAVFCPGSRNAPLAFALHAADAEARLRLHVRLDERTAAFLALGLALRSGRPVPVCTTSGTAVANLHPAMVEADHSRIPLIALTADRPPELVGSGASQTIAQAGLFGAATRHTVVLQTGTGAPGEHQGWRSALARALSAALGRLGGPPGPVHVDVPFRPPLVPPPGGVATPPGRCCGRPWTEVGTAVRRPLSSTALDLDPDAPTLVVAGHGAPPGLPVGTAPVIAEPTSVYWSRGLRAGPWLLGSPLRHREPPRQVVVAGRPTLHRSVQALLADPDVAVYVADDPSGATWTDVASTVRGVGLVPPLSPPPGWTASWAAADRRAAALLAERFDASGGTTGMRLARALVAALPRATTFVLGASNPVRDVALAAVPRADLTVLSNRGVAGIDGTVSTAIGAGLAAGGPTVALLGDLTFLHDTTALWIGPDEPVPDLAIVVLNDRGGGIFSLLEQGAPAYTASFERVFGTPNRVDLRMLCRAAGIPHQQIDDLRDLPSALACGPSGLQLLEMRADRAGLRQAHQELAEEIRALSGLVAAAATD